MGRLNTLFAIGGCCIVIPALALIFAVVGAIGGVILAATVVRRVAFD